MLLKHFDMRVPKKKTDLKKKQISSEPVFKKMIKIAEAK